MTPKTIPVGKDAGAVVRDESALRLRLYVARTTPNSMRAVSNLSAALSKLNMELEPPALEQIDVFAQPKRALTDGVIVTPTLIGTSRQKRVVLLGDLADQALLNGALRSLLD